MSKEEIICLIKEIEPDDNVSGYIDCGVTTDYMDNGQYNRIVAAIKQSLEMHNKNEELTKKLEDVETKLGASSLNVEYLIEINKIAQKEIKLFMEEQCKFLNGIKDIKYPLRIGDYLFKKVKDGVVYLYDPLKEPEPIEVKLLIIENSGKSNVCPSCKKELGKYPALSRKDNKTEICSNCGMLEALEDFHKANKDKKE